VNGDAALDLDCPLPERDAEVAELSEDEVEEG
jgi:hypothetical protein